MRIKTLIATLGWLLLASLVLSACAPAAAPSPTPEPTPAPVVLTDGLGRQFSFADPYQKIVSIAASNTEILFAIGAGEQVVARDAFSDYPEAALAVTDIGGGWGEVDMETVVALEPDLVLAAQINASEVVTALEQLGLNVYYLSNPTDLEGMYENLRIVAQLTGHEEQAEQLIASLQERVQAVDEVIAPLSYRPSVFYELDGTDPNAPWTPGPGTFIDLLIERAGGFNIGASLDSDWAQISIEALITQNPEIILLGDAVWGGITPEMVAARAGWDSITAVQEGKVYPFDDNLVSRPGPRLVDGLEALAKLLHPADFD
ncbi:MAG TPA: cobalamin-binding protein [Anaerolineales bacterium]|nr:cobalamin-binding protein [Anaerolineales bacterium]